MIRAHSGAAIANPSVAASFDSGCSSEYLNPTPLRQLAFRDLPGKALPGRFRRERFLTHLYETAQNRSLINSRIGAVPGTVTGAPEVPHEGVFGTISENGRVEARQTHRRKNALRDNSFNSDKTRRMLQVNGREYQYFSLAAAQDEGLAGVTALPYTLKILLENLLRRHVNGNSDTSDLDAFRRWLIERNTDCELSFSPTRVMMPESSGIPLLGDMAAMRDAMVQLSGDANDINPVVPVDVIVDHSVTVEQAGSTDALVRNMALEFEQNSERFGFLRWASKAFSRLRVFPPGSGICHQINLENLARVVWTDEINGALTARPRTDLQAPGNLLGSDCQHVYRQLRAADFEPVAGRRVHQLVAHTLCLSGAHGAARLCGGHL